MFKETGSYKNCIKMSNTWDQRFNKMTQDKI